MNSQFGYRLHDGRWAVCRLAPDAPLPAWASAHGLVSVTRTANELSIVCRQEVVPPGVQAQRDWACLELEGPIPFQATGVLHGFLAPLAGAGIPIFAVSTYDTDWVLVPAADLDRAVSALQLGGHLPTR